MKLSQLQLQTGRDPKERHVKQLLRIFKTDGCAQYDSQHSVPVVINERLLLSVLHAQHAGASYLPTIGTDAPMLRFPADTCITCLHGCRRIAAAKRFLKLQDQWWIVEVFSDGE